MAQAPFVLAAVSAAYLALAIYFAGRQIPGYSHQRDTISELGEHGGIHATVVSFAVFLPVAVALLVVAYLMKTANPAVALLSLSIAAGYGIAALFPCDPGAPASGSLRNTIHNLGGAAEYLGGTLALFRLAETEAMNFRFAGFLVFGSLVLFSFAGPWRGAIQRVAEATLFLCLIAALKVN